MDEDDPFAFIFDLSQISPSQEELLHRCALIGDTHPDDQPPPCSAVVPETSAGILMITLPETQDPGKDATALGSGPQDQDVFHTPPEKTSSLPNSGDEPLDHCAVNRTPDVDDDTLEFVDFRGDSEATACADLGGDSDLGFSEFQFVQPMDEELVDGESRGIKRDAVGDKFEGLGAELASQDGSSESPMKKLKLSDPKSDSDSSRACLGIESEKVEEGNENCEEKLESEKVEEGNVGADVQAGEQGFEENGVSMQNELCSNGLGYGEGDKQKNKTKISVFDVLKLLAENSNSDDDSDEEEDGIENVSLLEAFKSRGLTLPRPRWWPDNDK